MICQALHKPTSKTSTKVGKTTRAAMLEAIVKEHGPQAIPQVAKWLGSQDSQARFLVERGDADTIIRPGNFARYLERAQEARQGTNGMDAGKAWALVLQAIQRHGKHYRGPFSDPAHDSRIRVALESVPGWPQSIGEADGFRVQQLERAFRGAWR